MNALVTRLTLGIAGALATGIGAAIAMTPDTFYGSYGIVLPASADLYSELRAPGANLAVLGALIAIGAMKEQWTRVSAALGTTVFLAYAAGRLLGIAFDGVPSEAILLALAIEGVLGVLCALALRSTRHQAGWKDHARMAG